MNANISKCEKLGNQQNNSSWHRIKRNNEANMGDNDNCDARKVAFHDEMLQTTLHFDGKAKSRIIPLSSKICDHKAEFIRVLSSIPKTIF